MGPGQFEVAANIVAVPQPIGHAALQARAGSLVAGSDARLVVVPGPTGTQWSTSRQHAGSPQANGLGVLSLDSRVVPDWVGAKGLGVTWVAARPRQVHIHFRGCGWCQCVGEKPKWPAHGSVHSVSSTNQISCMFRLLLPSHCPALLARPNRYSFQAMRCRMPSPGLARMGTDGAQGTATCSVVRSLHKSLDSPERLPIVSSERCKQAAKQAGLSKATNSFDTSSDTNSEQRMQRETFRMNQKTLDRLCDTLQAGSSALEHGTRP